MKDVFFGALFGLCVIATVATLFYFIGNIQVGSCPTAVAMMGPPK